MKYLIVILALFLMLPALSEEDHHEGHNVHEDEHQEEAHHDEEHDEHGHGSSGIGEGKAILETQEDGNRFKLSRESKEFLKIKTAPIESLAENQYRVPSSALVSYQKHKAVYVFSNDWFEIKEVKVISSDSDTVFIYVGDIHSGAQVAVSGLGFLRVAHLQASGQGGQGHAH